MKEIKTLKEAREFVFSKHTCRALDTRWDEYLELVLELGLFDKDSSTDYGIRPKRDFDTHFKQTSMFSSAYLYLLALFLSSFLIQGLYL